MNNFIEILEYGNQRAASINLYSKLLQNNIIFINGEFNTNSVTEWQAQLLYLKSTLQRGDTINLYINSEGGEVYSCLGLYDLIQYTIKSGINVSTVNIAKAFSAAGYILMSGSPGLRQSLPNATTMLHQPSYGSYGTVTDMNIEMREGQRLKDTLNNIVKTHASTDLIELLEKDLYLTSQDMLNFNIIDHII